MALRENSFSRRKSRSMKPKGVLTVWKHSLLRIERLWRMLSVATPSAQIKQLRKQRRKRLNTLARLRCSKRRKKRAQSICAASVGLRTRMHSVWPMPSVV